MQTVLVTGARGLLGATLMRELGAFKLKPVASTSDIRDKEAVLQEVVALQPQWIVHTAAMTNVAECEKNPEAAHAVNADGTAHVIEAARAVGARAIYISTASVFKGDKGNYVEEDQPVATNVYNQTKIDGEQSTLAYEKGIVLRLNLVGIHPDGSRGKNFLEWLVDTVRADKDLKLFNDQRINALSNWSIARLVGQCIEGEVKEKILHIGTADTISKAEFARLVLKHYPEYCGSVTEVSVDSIGDGAVRPKEMWLNTDKAGGLLGPMPTNADEIGRIFSRQPFV